MNFDDLAGSVAGLSFGAYIIAVVYHGNTRAFGHEIKNEKGYLEFLAALILLGLVNKYGPGGKIKAAMTTFVIVAVLIKLAAKTDLNTNLAKFAAGQQSGLDTLHNLLTSKG